ncbi:hypothetical protein HDV00_011423 [Rhizophlyctis rosea]|nr:hypothetical protein HDV00_011423 [Rhizophlyctis rosea]
MSHQLITRLTFDLTSTAITADAKAELFAKYQESLRPPTAPESDVDEGFEDDFPDEFPFWYGGSSGVQRIERRDTPGGLSSASDDDETNVSGDTDAATLLNERRETYRDHDSVLHYFIATNQSERMLDEYLDGIIHAFLNEPAPVFAANHETPESLQAKFGKFSVPNRRPSTGDGSSVETYLQQVKTNVIDKATRVSSPKMIGHMTTALPYFHRPLARLLAALNQNVVKIETASTMTYLERQTISMLHREFFSFDDDFYSTYMHHPEHSLGVFTSGGTIANVTAMWSARNRALRARPEEGFKGVEREGLFKALKFYGYEGAVIVGSRLMHYSFKKAADLLGLGDDGLVLIPTDENFGMRMDLLKEKVDKLIANKILVVAIVGIAGTTETGSIDPLLPISTYAHTHKIHFHVDAAWGGPLIFSLEHRSKLTGIENADTITVDGHKQLYTPMGLGLLLMRDPSLSHHIRKTANYIIRNGSVDLGRYTLEGSRPATSLHLHASLVLLGRDGLGALVTRSATLVRQLAARIEGFPGRCFQCLHEPATNILLYRYVPAELRNRVFNVDGVEDLTEEERGKIDEATRRVQSRLASKGVTEGEEKDAGGKKAGAESPGFVSRTRVMFRGREVDAFRVVIANPLTRWEDVESVLREQVEIGAEVEEEMKREEVRRWDGWPFDM